MNNTTNKRNLNIGGIEYATKFASKARPFEIFMNKSVTPNALYYKDGNNDVYPITEPTDLTVIQNDLTTLSNDVTTLENTVSALPPSPTTAIVNISSAQILAMGTTPIELLPAAGAGMYYEWEARLEFTHLTTSYTMLDDAIYVGSLSSYNGSGIHREFIQRGYSTFAYASNKLPSDVVPPSIGFEITVNIDGGLNEAVSLFTWNSTDPTNGDGTLRAIITYTVRTFGA